MLIGVFVTTGHALEMSGEERAWFETHQILRIGTGNEWAPFDFEDKGEWAGVSREYIEAVARELGLRLEFVPHRTWMQGKQNILDGTIDLLPAAYHDPDLGSRCYFTGPYFNVKEFLFAREGMLFNDLSALKGKQVVFVRGSESAAVLRSSYPDIKIVWVDTIKDALDKLVTRQADGYIDSLGAVSFVMRESGLAGVHVAFPVNLVDTRLRMVCAPNAAPLCSVLDKCLNNISFLERQRIDQRWILLPESSQTVPLTAEERLWMNRFGTVRLGRSPQLAPYSFVVGTQIQQGIVADYLRLIAERTGLEFQSIPVQSSDRAVEELGNGDLDVIDILPLSQEQRDCMEFIRLDLAMDNVIVSREGDLAQSSLSQCAGLRVGVVGNFGLERAIRNNHPDIDLHMVPNTVTGLKQLLDGRLNAFVTDLASLDYARASSQISGIRVSGVTPYSVQLYLGVRKDMPVLTGILRKGLASISEVERTNIYRHWISVRYESLFDYSILWKFLGVFVLILSGTLYWNRRLQKEIDVRVRTEAQLRQVHEELTRSKELAESATRAKSEFLANMSHEIRTPMNSVLGFAELLSGMVSDPVQKDYLASIRIGGNALLRIINDILDLSKIESGQLQLVRESVSLHTVIGELRALFHDKIRQKNLYFDLVVAEDVPDYVWLDGGRLRQMLFNLVGNAIKFTEKGGVTVHVRSLDRTQEDMTLQIDVADTGIGIDPANLKSIFEAFAQQPGQDRRYGGTGLGLSICTRLARMMDGRVEARSKHGEGSIFSIYLQNVRMAEGASDVSSASEPDRIRFRPASVLVVDDVEDNRKLIREMLALTPLVIHEVSDGRKALELLHTETIDVILLDLYMPGMNGYELMGRIRDDQEISKIPVVAVTASVLVEDLEKVEQHGFASALRKPITRSTLFSMLVRYLPHDILTGHGLSVPGDESCHSTPESERVLGETLMQRWMVIKDQGDISQFEAFAGEVAAAAKTYDLPPVQTYATELLNACQSFNVGRALQLINEYPEVAVSCTGTDVE